MSRDEIYYWIALKKIEGLGNKSYIQLIETFGNPSNVFTSPREALTENSGVNPPLATKIREFNGWKEVDRERKLLDTYGAHIITYRDPLYPERLLHIHDFPPFLYVRGTLKRDDVSIAVIGSRRASTYGLYTTEKLSRELAMEGITVVSGFARGIDSAAHRGALAGKGRTIAVLGCGLDIVYPPENTKLYDEILTHGAVISEYPFGTPPIASHFPSRNRIISGVSLGVVVVEASDKSGSLITARIALEQGREVFAVPGAIDSAGSRGTHKLIKEGAKLVENIHDILEEIQPQLVRRQNSDSYITARKEKKDAFVKPPISPSKAEPATTTAEREWELTENERIILDAIHPRGAVIDDIIEKTHLKTKEVLNILLTLELRGIIKQLPGNIFVLKE